MSDLKKKNLQFQVGFSIRKWLFISEELRYPPEEGFEGRRKALRAIQEIASGFSPEYVALRHECNKSSLDFIEFIEKPAEYENYLSREAKK